jgi:mono/diheme cytochrome c family protein
VGTIGLAPAIKGPHWQHLGARREYLPTVLLKGMAGSITVSGQMIVGNMPSFAGVLDDAALAAVANHLMELQGPQGRAPYTPEEMASVRQSKGDPGQTRKLRSQILPP